MLVELSVIAKKTVEASGPMEAKRQMVIFSTEIEEATGAVVTGERWQMEGKKYGKEN